MICTNYEYDIACGMLRVNIYQTDMTCRVQHITQHTRFIHCPCDLSVSENIHLMYLCASHNRLQVNSMPCAGVTFKQLLLSHGGGFGDDRNLKIGRSPPLSSNKSATHFPQVQGFAQCLLPAKGYPCLPTYTRPKNAHLQLRRDTGIPYDEMLFFDDSNWYEHTTMVAKNCPGVVTVRTPQVSQSISRSLLCTHSVSAVDLRHILCGNSITFLKVIIV